MYTPSEKTQIILHDFSPVYMLLKHQKHCYIIRTLRVIQQETGYIWLICLETSVYIFRRQLSTWALLFAQLANSQLIYTLHAMPCRQWSGHPFPFCSNLYSIYPKRKTKEWIIIHFSYAMVKTTSPWPLLRFSLGRGRQWLQGRSHIIRVPRWFRKDPRVKYLVPHIRHAGKAPMNAVCKLLWVCLLLWCQQLTLPDRIQRCVGVLPIIW